MKKNIILLSFLFLFLSIEAQENKVVLITIDGLRWEELFGGADTSLISNKQYVPNIEELNRLFNRPSSSERRKALFPFIWNKVSNIGVLLGNRWENCKMNVTNEMHFSYPGYNEILCGYPDDVNINSNDKIYNPNVNILEIANNTPEYRGKVLAFCSWDVFPYILNEKRSLLEVNAGFRHSLSPDPTKEEALLDRIQDNLTHHFDYLREDVLTYQYALEAMKSRKPAFVYIALGEPDDFAHAGRYDRYLKTSRRIDDFIAELWDFVQTDTFYKDKTTFIITCDHGRGDDKENPDAWKHHSVQHPHAGDTWLIAFGKNIPAKGEIKIESQYYSNQIAATIASLLNIPFHPTHEGTGKKIVF